ncbi:MAG TPA: O-antigen ligase family protein [Ramlibacter sp.]|nr:O-antigen ligase family protein [Ramlibacter sp.]
MDTDERIGSPIAGWKQRALQHGPATAWLIAAAFLPYFVVRGWLNAAVVPLCLFGLFQLVRPAARRALAVAADRRVMLLAAALCTPLLCVIAVQLLHWQLVPRYFDSPLRLALCAGLLIFLRQRRIDCLPLMQVALPLSVVLCAVLVFAPGADRYYWGQHRLASYFMDPLMLAQHVAIVGFMGMFLMDYARPDARWLRVLTIVGFVLAMLVSLSTQSRTGWLMMPILMVLWLIGFRRFNRPSLIALSVAGVLATGLVAYFFSSTIHARVDQVGIDLASYLQGNGGETSTGIRLSLFQIGWAAFLAKPLAGWGFATLPSPADLPGLEHLWNEAVRFYFYGAGTHNEWVQAVMRMGVFGLIARAAVYGAPLLLFAQAACSRNDRQRAAGYAGLAVVIGYLTAGLTSEVFNLVYAAAFYGLAVATLGAVALGRKPA